MALLWYTAYLFACPHGQARTNLLFTVLAVHSHSVCLLVQCLVWPLEVGTVHALLLRGVHVVPSSDFSLIIPFYSILVRSFVLFFMGGDGDRPKMLFF